MDIGDGKRWWSRNGIGYDMLAVVVRRLERLEVTAVGRAIRK